MITDTRRNLNLTTPITVRLDDRERWQAALIRGLEHHLTVEHEDTRTIGDVLIMCYSVGSYSQRNHRHDVEVMRDADGTVFGRCSCEAGTLSRIPCQHLALSVNRARLWPTELGIAHQLTLAKCKMDDCERPAYRRDICWLHYEVEMGHRDASKPFPPYFASDTSSSERFWGNVDQGGPDECWQWPRCTHPSGHGRINWDGHTTTAHRVAWELTNGPIPEGMVVCHHCDNPPCCNPAHLFVGTQMENVRDCIDKGRAIRGKPRGENHGAAKLTEAQVVEIRRLHGAKSAAELSRQFGVSSSTIRNIVSGKRWKHIATAPAVVAPQVIDIPQPEYRLGTLVRQAQHRARGSFVVREMRYEVGNGWMCRLETLTRLDWGWVAEADITTATNRKRRVAA